MGLGKKLSPAGEIEFTYEDDDGEEVSVLLPGSHEVCSGCGGHGRHTSRNIDGNGITSDEWEQWGEEEREMYLTGGYDVTCEECGGEKVVVAVNEEALENRAPELFKLYRGYCEGEAEMYREKRMRERGYEF